MRKEFTTPKGTVLPLLNLRGKEYLEVKYRLVWFREENPTWGIETEFPSVGQSSATAKATIKDAQGRIIATSHKCETASDFPDFLEKAETSAIGRALALIGYGTQFCADELDEGERLADSPVPPKSGPVPLKAVSNGPESLGDYVITFGQKFPNKKLSDCGPFNTVNGVPEDLLSYAVWLRESAKKKNKPLQGVVLETVEKIEAFVEECKRKKAQ